MPSQPQQNRQCKMVKSTILLGSLLIPQYSAFCPSDVLKRPYASPIQAHHRNAIILSQSFVPFADVTEPKNSEPIEQVDANGKTFSPGVTVAIAPNTKVTAYHVPKAAYGSFDPNTREFIPAEESNLSRGTRCLILPEGMRGEVTKVYNVNEWDRAHPILVEFKEGSDRAGIDGGFILPKSFSMHLSASEIVVVD